MISKLEFPDETLQYFLKIYFEKGLQKEFAHTLCLKDGKIYPGGRPHWGNRNSVEPPERICEKGKPIGDIHSHPEPHFDPKPPFNKGLTNIDFFRLIQDGLTGKIHFPHISCVISPTVDDKGRLSGLRIDCEQYDNFTEEDIKMMRNGTIVKGVPKRFSDEEIQFLKECDPPRNNLSLYIALSNLKTQKKEKGLMKQDSIFIECKYDGKKIQCNKPDKNILSF